MSGLLSPKNAIFYLSLFTAMVSPQTSLGMRGLYGLWMASLVLFWIWGWPLPWAMNGSKTSSAAGS